VVCSIWRRLRGIGNGLVIVRVFRSRMNDSSRFSSIRVSSKFSSRCRFSNSRVYSSCSTSIRVKWKSREKSIVSRSISMRRS